MWYLYGFVLLAGVATSVLLDHFGWVGFERHPASIGRIIGAALMVGGVAMVATL